MGQYYIIVNLDTKVYVDPMYIRESRNRNHGIKLCEHIHFGSAVVRSVEKLLAEGGDWYKARIVWAGDYADYEPGHGILFVEPQEGQEGQGGQTNNNDNSSNGEEGNQRIEPANLYRLFKSSDWGTLLENLEVATNHYRYIVNHDTNEFVDIVRAKRGCFYHPLALLTADGNGLGGGDYCDGEDNFNSDLIGEWARDHISVQDSHPEASFSELKTTINTFAWDEVGHVIVLRCLVQQGRATVATAPVNKKDGGGMILSQAELAVQNLIAGMEDSIFDEVMSFLL
mmetsp:Transcript_107097/g.160109  ORF Transcript_107097/g.160109 Transcript_107097/m.160109 type:complete len:284 (+) Transcript_107097:76-927(+)